MFKCYRQLEHSDCGITCVKMIARHFGAKIPFKVLKEQSDINRLGMSITDIVDCCNRVGIDARAIKLHMQYVRTMPLPAILYWKQKHFVVLYKINKRINTYHIADPADGKIIYNEDDFSRGWIPNGDNKGMVILTEASDDFIKDGYAQDSVLKNFYKYIKSFLIHYKQTFIYTLLITAILLLADFLIPILLRQTIDDGIGLKDIGLVLSLLLTQFAIMIGELVSSQGLNWILTKTGLKMNLEMVDSFLIKLASFPMSFFDRKVSSDFVQKINDQSRIKDFLLSFPNSPFIILLNLFVFSILLLHYSPLIFCIVMFVSLLQIGWNALFLNKRKTIDLAMFTHLSDNRNHAYELTNGMADLKVNNAEKTKINKWRTTQKHLNNTSLRSKKLSIIQDGGHAVFAKIKDLLVVGISAILVINNEMSLGVMMTLGYITGRLSQPFTQISIYISDLQDALLSFQRIEDVIDGVSEFHGNKTYSIPSIQMNDVWFKYAGSTSPFVIKGVSLIIEPGSVNAIVGESGCGKSTLIKLMLGFYIPQKGCIRLSEENIEEINPSDWMSHCGVVLQEGKIFTGSIFENISMSSSSSENDNVEKVISVLKIVEMWEFVCSLPMGLYTQLGVAGIELSGGQKQRIMIARALYKDPEILFLDEATSSLDANNERIIVENIMKIGNNKTIIIAAHRLSTVQNADNIIFMKDGQIEESGTHKDLLIKEGLYWKLVKNQLQLSLCD